MGVGRIVGRYVLYDEIASGGMAAIHLARLVDPVGFSRTLAIKRLHPQLARDPEFAAKFLDEARLAARVRHTSVVSVIDVASVAEELFLVMEYVHGEALSKLLRAAYTATSGPIPVGIGLTIMVDVLYGLHAAHETKSEKGEPLLIVHRDVSPQNVVVGADGIARVLDFGIAKAASQAQTQSDVLKGKLAYMSPEQFRSEPLDRRADIFSASVVLWEVLTGRRLFADEEPASVLRRVLHDPIAPPSVHAPDLPAGLDDIVMKGLERDPARRFSSAHEMASAIERTSLVTRPAEVGAWVERTVGPALALRAERIAQIEKDGATPSPGPKPAEAAVEPTMMLEAEGADTSATERSVVAPARRRRWPLLAFSGFAAVAAVLGAARLRSAKAIPPPAAVSAASAEPAVPFASAVSASSAPPTAAPAAPASSVPKMWLDPPRKRPRPDCTPPYYFDDDGVKRFKPKCI
jgi:serine/threonine-protein kinase